MDMQGAIRRVTEGNDLSAAEMTEVMGLIMGGEATPAQIGGLLIGLRMKGETVDEIAAAAQVMRELATRVVVHESHLVDTCGTGGDGAHTFNISTTSAFVAAAAGARVAKHGNRSVSSKSGSADVLEAAGVRLDLTPDEVARCIREVGVGFMFAPRHHGAMKHAIGPRREMGVRTLFNLLGPLTNPAGAPNQVIGVFANEWLEPIARVLGKLGSRHVLVVRAEDGMDEISCVGPTHVAELKDGDVAVYTITPEQFGMTASSSESLGVADAGQSLAVMRDVLGGRGTQAARDIVALNAGAAIYAAGLCERLGEGVDRARELLANGAGLERLEALVELSNSVERET